MSMLPTAEVFTNLSSQTSLPFFQFNQQNHTHRLHKLQFSALSRNDVNRDEMSKKTLIRDRSLPSPYISSPAFRPSKIYLESLDVSPSCSGLRCGSRKLGFVGARSVVARAEKEDDVEEKEPAERETQTPASWRSSFQRANSASQIFMAAFVWISLFFGISVMDNEIGGGRKGRRGPRL